MAATEMTTQEARLARLMLPILVEERDAISQAIAGIERMAAIEASAAVAKNVVEGIMAVAPSPETTGRKP